MIDASVHFVHPDVAKDKRWKEKVTLRKWNAHFKVLHPPVINLDAFHLPLPDGSFEIVVRNVGAMDCQPNWGSEITLSDGSAYYVVGIGGGGGSPETFCQVKRKA